MEPMPQNPQPNQYDFILKPPQAPKKRLFGGGSLKNRIIVVVAGLLLLMIIGAIVTSIISNSNKGPTNQLKSIVALQQEIIRIADGGTDDALTTDGRAFASTVKYSVQTDQKKLQEVLESQSIKLKPEELSAKKSDKPDEALTVAAANNRYDEELKEILSEKLEEYRTELKSAFDASKGQKTKSVLSDAYTSVGNLLAI
jgi:hypothetical protein